MENYGVAGIPGSVSYLARISTQRSTPPIRELNLLAFEDNIFFSYENNTSAWINEPIMQLCAHKSFDKMSYDAARAYSIGLMARDHHCPELTVKAGTLYQGVLVELASRLEKARKSEIARLIVPVMAMVGYEVGTQPHVDFFGQVLILTRQLITGKTDAHISHQDGIASIIRYCGPEVYQQQPLLVTFELARVVLVSCCA
jgi:hypothetical protein